MATTKKIADVINVTFDVSISRNNKRNLADFIEQNFGIILGKIHGKLTSFILPAIVQDTGELYSFIKSIGGMINESSVVYSTENNQWLKEKAIEFITSRLTDIENEKDNAIIFGSRSTKFKNVTREILRLRRYGEVYSALTGLNKAPLERELTKSISQLNKFYDTKLG